MAESAAARHDAGSPPIDAAPQGTVYRTEPDSLDAIRVDLDALLGRVALVEATPDPSIGPDGVEALCRAGRELFGRRALERAAEHAAALLPLLGRPRLVTPGFVPLDPQAVGDALDAAIAALDSLDGDPDGEPWLGWTGAGIGRADLGGASDGEDGDDDERTLGWSANVSQLALDHATDDGDLTAPERHGRGFVRCGPDDEERDGRDPWPVPIAGPSREVAHA